MKNTIDTIYSQRILNAIDAYEKKFGSKDGIEGALFYTDVQQIADMSADKWELITNSLRAGFMIGYRKGRADQQKIYKNK